MANVIVQIYGIRTVEDARMVIDAGGHHIGVSYGKIKRTDGQLTCEKAKEIFLSIILFFSSIKLFILSPLTYYSI